MKIGFAHGTAAVLALVVLVALPAAADTSATASAKAAIKVGQLNLVYGPAESIAHATYDDAKAHLSQVDK